MQDSSLQFLLMELQTWRIKESQAEEASTHFLVVGFRDFLNPIDVQVQWCLNG